MAWPPVPRDFERIGQFRLLDVVRVKNYTGEWPFRLPSDITVGQIIRVHGLVDDQGYVQEDAKMITLLFSNGFAAIFDSTTLLPHIKLVDPLTALVLFGANRGI